MGVNAAESTQVHGGAMVKVPVRLPPLHIAALHAKAAENDRTFAQELRRAVRFYVAPPALDADLRP